MEKRLKQVIRDLINALIHLIITIKMYDLNYQNVRLIT